MASSLITAVSPAGLESDRCRALVLTGFGATGGRVFTDDDLIITSLSHSYHTALYTYYINPHGMILMVRYLDMAANILTHLALLILLTTSIKLYCIAMALTVEPVDVDT